MATLAQFTAEVDQARDAMAAENYKAARKYLTIARVTLLAIPDSEMTEERLEWQRAGLDSIYDEINRLEKEQALTNKAAGNGPILFSKIEQVRE